MSQNYPDPDLDLQGRFYYTIENAPGRVRPEWRAEYGSLEAAAQALREAMGWDGVYLSASYPLRRGAGQSAYPTGMERDLRGESQLGPRVVRYAVVTYTIALDLQGMHNRTVQLTPGTTARIASELSALSLPEGALRRSAAAIQEELFEAATATSTAW